jgi:hypothetical protein
VSDELKCARLALREIRDKARDPYLRGIATLGLQQSGGLDAPTVDDVLGPRGGWRNRAAKRNGKRGGRPREALPCIHCGAKTRERDASRRAWCGCAP